MLRFVLRCAGLCSLAGAVLLFLAMHSCASMPQSKELPDAVRDYRGVLPVFPGAEGFGVGTHAGRGGAIMHVTSLAASGPGTLREALSAGGTRTVVFEVGGVIDTNDNLVISEPYVTVAGQTAPAPGITIIGAGLVINTHDVLVQHIRVRPGDRLDGPDPSGRDAIAVAGRPDGSLDVRNIVVDHCSISWAVDEGASTWYPGVCDVTFRDCIIAENLSRSIHPEKEHSKGFLIGDYTKRIACIGNLFAHNMLRNPYVKGDVSAVVANNLIYNPGANAIHFGDIEGHGPSLGLVACNVLIPGPDTRRRVPLVDLLLDMKTQSRVYGFNNEPGGRKTVRVWHARQMWQEIVHLEDAPVRAIPLTLEPGASVAERVLASAGAWPAERDPIDRRIVDSVRHRTGRIIDSPAEVGGFPAYAATERALILPEDPHGDADRDGYTNLEEWLHGWAAALEKGGRPPAPLEQ